MMKPANQCLTHFTSYDVIGEACGIHVSILPLTVSKNVLKLLVLLHPIAQWEPITAAELHSAALRQKGRAAGLDGFSGTEVSHLRHRFWTDVVHLFREFERSGGQPRSME